MFHSRVFLICFGTIEIFARLQLQLYFNNSSASFGTIEIFARLQPIQKSHNVFGFATIIIKLRIL